MALGIKCDSKDTRLGLDDIFQITAFPFLIM